MTDFLEEKRKEIDARLSELRPLMDEYSRLEKAAAALAGVNGGPGSRGAPSPPTRSRGTGKPPRTAPTRRSGSTKRRGRPRGSGARGKQALELVKAKPGITIADLAKAMSIKANYLYRVMPTLESEGLVIKRNKGWHPA